MPSLSPGQFPDAGRGALGPGVPSPPDPFVGAIKKVAETMPKLLPEAAA